jgi:N4-(beta-N-acetylglucosaminyl)-L-asparaginase
VSDSSLSRRTFLGAAGAAVAGAALRPNSLVAAPVILRRSAALPVACGSANGMQGMDRTWALLSKGGDTLDAGIEGVKVVELNPNDHSVGYGGLPNAEGVVQLDASCMHGPTRRAGSVGCIEGIKTPSEVARLVMKYTNHFMLVGHDAQRFAVSYGFKVEDLLTPEAREMWLHWRANMSDSDNYNNVPANEKLEITTTGTCNMNVVGANGDISSVTTTSGVSYKVPGRVGDSPIIGAGQYTNNDVGAAGSTGLGEANWMVCGAFLTVEHMRQGMSPTDACLETLRRVAAIVPPRWRGADGRPNFGLQYYAVNKKGQYGAASFGPASFAVCDEKGPRHEPCAVLYS